MCVLKILTPSSMRPVYPSALYLPPRPSLTQSPSVPYLLLFGVLFLAADLAGFSDRSRWFAFFRAWVCRAEDSVATSSTFFLFLSSNKVSISSHPRFCLVVSGFGVWLVDILIAMISRSTRVIHSISLQHHQRSTKRWLSNTSGSSINSPG